jgi:FHA domain-containing protein
MGLQQFERRLERLVEGVFAKAFRSGLQPVEVGRRITREMDLGRTVGVRGVIAPNYFRIVIDPSDHEKFVSYEEALLRELGDAAREHAKDEGYRFLGPVTVELETAEVGPGVFQLEAEVREGPGGGPYAALVLGDGSRIELGEEPVCIGRAEDCEVQVSDKNVSRRHAEVRREGGGFVLVDLDSTNGTRVNGARAKRRELADGDEITVGATTVRFEMS